MDDRSELATDEARDRSLLARRTAALSQRVDQTDDHQHDVRAAIVVGLAGLRVAIAAAEVGEVLAPGPVSQLPPAGRLVGVRSARGRLIPVADLAPLLGLEPTDGSSDSWTVVLPGPAGDVGLLVDSVEGITELHWDRIAAPPDQFEGRSVLGISDDGTLVVRAAQIASDPGLVIEPVPQHGGDR